MALAPHHAAMLAASDIAPHRDCRPGVLDRHNQGRLARLGFPPDANSSRRRWWCPSLTCKASARPTCCAQMPRASVMANPTKYEFMRGFRMALDVPNLEWHPHTV